MKRLALFSILAIMLTACDGSTYNMPLTEYQQGYNEGVKAAQECKAHGALVAAACAIGFEFNGKPDASKSNEWNCGFIDGWHKTIGT